jgi:hypothetical protein
MLDDDFDFGVPSPKGCSIIFWFCTFIAALLALVILWLLFGPK